MIQRLKKALKGNSGFTLTELVVAMAIVAILAAIAVPSFLGARHGAYDAQAQSAVGAGLDAAQQHFATYDDFSDSNSNTCGGSSNSQLASDLQSKDGNFQFVGPGTRSTNPHMISVEAAMTYDSNGNSLGCKAVYVAVLSKSGTCWTGRLTEEGAYFKDDKTLPIVVDDTDQTRIAGQTGLDLTGGTGVVNNGWLNGRAYGAIKAPNSSARGTDTGPALYSPTSTDVTTQSLCTAHRQVASGGADNIGVRNLEWAASWQEVTPSVNGNRA